MSKKEMGLAIIDLAIIMVVTVFLISALKNIVLMSADVVYGTELRRLVDLVSAANKLLVVACIFSLKRWFLSDNPGLKLFDFLTSIEVKINKAKDSSNPKE